MFYLHECQLPEVFEVSDPKVNILVQWLSTVMPAVFGIRVIDKDLVVRMMIAREK